MMFEPSPRPMASSEESKQSRRKGGRTGTDVLLRTVSQHPQ